MNDIKTFHGNYIANKKLYIVKFKLALCNCHLVSNVFSQVCIYLAICDWILENRSKSHIKSGVFH